MDKDIINQIVQEYKMAKAEMRESSQTNATRLDRIEQKIDKLADAMISLARAEEKILALQDDHDNTRDRLNKLSVKLDDIQKAVDDNARTVSLINKVVYAAMVAAVGAYVAHMWM
jgi:predicted  nucleic acid-binding Zn-ribbon protein